jgi:hypothetical protein
VVLGLALLAVGGASLFVGYRGWRTVQQTPRLLGAPLRENIRELRRTRRGTVWLVFLGLAAAVGAAGGVLLAIEVQEGKDRHFEKREQR